MCTSIYHLVCCMIQICLGLETMDREQEIKISVLGALPVCMASAF